MTGVAMCLAALLVPASGHSAAASAARYPAEAAAALAAFAAPVPDQREELALVDCSDHVTRVRAVAALGDAAAPSAEAITAIAAHLADPAEVVRQEALIASLRNADAVRPALLARMAADPVDVPTAPADWAAAALRVFGRGKTEQPLAG